MSLFGQKRDLRRNSRLFEFLAKPYSVTYAQVRALVRTCQETSKIHQILAVLGNDDIHQNSDFLRELSLSTQTGAFLLFFLLRASQLQKHTTSDKHIRAGECIVFINCIWR